MSLEISGDARVKFEVDRERHDSSLPPSKFGFGVGLFLVTKIYSAGKRESSKGAAQNVGRAKRSRMNLKLKDSSFSDLPRF